jgi:hypothetical protein
VQSKCLTGTVRESLVHNGCPTYLPILAVGIYLLLERHYQLLVRDADVSSFVDRYAQVLGHEVCCVTPSQKLSLQVVSQATHKPESHDHIADNK